jgi:hypothetical protein
MSDITATSAATLADHAERLGLAADRLENISHALRLPIPHAIHVDALRSQLPEVVKELRAAYVGITGENPWETHPT